MPKRLIFVALIAAAAACAGVDSAGRNARDEPLATPAPSAEPAQPAPSPAPPANVAAPDVALPPPQPQQQQQRRSGGDIVVPGQVERQVPPPAGDPRTVAERMADIRAWDECVMAVQAQAESDPLRPQLDQPEEVCSRQLGMTDRLAVPVSRRR